MSASAARATFVALAALALFTTSRSVREIVAATAATAPVAERAAGIARAVSWLPKSSDYLIRKAAFDAALGRFDAAESGYRRAIEAFPACARCWVGLAEVEANRGRDPRAALRHATRYGRSITSVRTRAAVVFARIGEDSAATENFRAALAGRDEEDIDDLFGLLVRLYPTDELLDRLVGPERLLAYFGFARRHLGVAESGRVWGRLPQSLRTANVRHWYSGYLIANGLVHDAQRVTFADSAPLLGTVLNGDFEHSIGDGWFDWSIDDGEGVRADVVACRDCPTGGRALRLRFDGEHNPDYHVARQVVAVEGGRRYRLRALARADAVTSASGGRLVVSGVRGREGAAATCRLSVASEDVRLTTPWRELSVEFDVPTACDGVRIHAARRPTEEVNRLIEGEIWFDDFRLELVAPTEQATQPSAPAALFG